MIYNYSIKLKKMVAFIITSFTNTFFFQRREKEWEELKTLRDGPVRASGHIAVNTDSQTHVHTILYAPVGTNSL